MVFLYWSDLHFLCVYHQTVLCTESEPDLSELKSLLGVMGVCWSDGLLSWMTQAGVLGWGLVTTVPAPHRLHLAPGLSRLPYTQMITQPLPLAVLGRAELWP